MKTAKWPYFIQSPRNYFVGLKDISCVERLFYFNAITTASHEAPNIFNTGKLHLEL
jgi:hypothetical protein